MRSVESYGISRTSYVDDDDETAVKRALADNRTGELAEWDWPVLKDIVQEFGPEPDIPGWSDEEFQKIPDDFGDSFSIADSSESGSKQITFYLSSPQAELIEEALQDVESRYDVSSGIMGNQSNRTHLLYGDT